MKTKIFPRTFGKLFRRDTRLRRAVALAVALGFATNALANPLGMIVQRGSASFTSSGSQLTVTAGNGALLNWSSFNIAPGETTTFVQPSSGSVVWNQIGGQSPSLIYGSLQANGVVILLNSSGFYFGPNSFVSVAGLVVSTANCVPPQNSGGAWEFNGPPPLAPIVNYGSIKVGQGGSVFLIADQVQNYGSISAPGGTIGFAAGQTVTLSERPDGRGMSMNVTLPQGSVDNYGNVVADGGTIALNAKVVNQDGLLQANSVQNQNGTIELVASDTVSLGANSQILASGDDTANGSAGGNVTIQSGNNFNDTVGSTISTTGGANGGNGGNVEISAPNVASLNSTMNATAQAGWTGGTFFLDPVNIILGTSTAGGAINVNTAFAGFSSIQLQASGNITLADGTAWDLSGSTGQTSGALVLQAGGNIIIGDGASISDAHNWSVSLAAGYNFVNHTVNYGTDINQSTGYITLNGTGDISTAAGGINLQAGQDITVNSGYVITTHGGSIYAHALAGTIDCGSDAQGYIFTSGATSIGSAYNLSKGLGGISTAAGGNVTLVAGGDVKSVLPGSTGYYYEGDLITVNNRNAGYTTGGCGAYGKQAGNVTIIAGGDVTGNYLVANGTGTIYAGVLMNNGNPMTDSSGNYILGTTGNAGTAQNSLALNLIKGGWNVTAGQDIYLQEVRNPNGVFNRFGSSSVQHLFDYAPDDYVNLTAGNLVQLGGGSMPRVDTSVSGLHVPIVYPGILTINAGAGGVVLQGGGTTFQQLILFPSPQGSLIINTTDGGSLTGNLPANNGAPQLFSIIVSDSGSQQYTSTGSFGSDSTFGVNDHADSPIHQGSQTPVELNISGNMSLVTLVSPEASQINVVGNMNNCGFEGMNLANTDITSIMVGLSAKQNMENLGILNPGTDGGLKVGGNIYNRGAFTSVDLGSVDGFTPPNLSVLNRTGGSPVPTSDLAASFSYNSTTHYLTYQNIPGTSVTTVLNEMVSLNALSPTDAAALLATYNTDGKSIPIGNPGYIIGGGGQFDIVAANVDLGTSPGIQSQGVGYYQTSNGAYPLANLFTTGSDINLDLTGSLTMYSSSVASLNGGSISINAGGSVAAGSPDFTVRSASARGIYTTGLGNVTVIADGDINVNGSRIAAYDGGNVTVESLNGNISAGTGGNGFVTVNGYSVNPKTGNVILNSTTIPGSGILATTLPTDYGRRVGNILVEAPNGDINASSGGIVQLPLNGVTSGNSLVEILAGSQLQDASGNPVYADNIYGGTAVQISPDRSIDAENSGVIGNNVKLVASGDIVGVIFARQNIDLNAVQNVSVTALAEGSVSASAGGSISGTIIGVGGVSASGSSIDASLESNNAVSGDTSGSKGLGQANVAGGVSQGLGNDDVAKAAAKSGESDDEEQNKKKGIALAQKVSRVTVVLPGTKKVSERAGLGNPL